MPTHVLSGLLVCEECGAAFHKVNGREYGCGSHRGGGDSACTNGIRVAVRVAERKLLAELAAAMLSPEGIAHFERRLRELLRADANAPKPAKRESTKATKLEAEIAHLRQLMTAGTLSSAVAQADIDKAEESRDALKLPEPEEKDIARVIRMLPNAARVLRERIAGGNAGLRDPRSIIQARNTLFNLFGGKVPLRRAPEKPGERPYLIARVAANRAILLEAAGICRKSGSGGSLDPQPLRAICWLNRRAA